MFFPSDVLPAAKSVRLNNYFQPKGEPQQTVAVETRATVSDDEKERADQAICHLLHEHNTRLRVGPLICA
jgi:hypothetical protein